jgi:integrase
VKRYLEDWVKGLDSVKLVTKESYEENIRLHLIPHIGHIKLQQLRPLDIKNLLTVLKDKNLSARSRTYVLAILNAALNEAMALQMLIQNPCKGVTRPKSERYKIRPMTVEESKQFLGIAKERDDHYYALFLLAISFGFRAGELLALQWQDIDFKTGKIQVRHTLNRKYLTLTAPKTEESIRSIDISDQATIALQRHKDKQSEIKQRTPNWDSTLNLVFPTTVGTPTKHSNLVNRHFKPILRAAGLPDTIRFHDLRHTCASLMLTANVHPRIVQEILGHSDIKMTLSTYSHLLPNLQKDVSDAVGDLLE